MVSHGSTTLSCLKGTMLKTFLRRRCLHLVVLVVALQQVSATSRDSEPREPGCLCFNGCKQDLNRLPGRVLNFFAEGPKNPSKGIYAFWTVIKNLLTVGLLITLLVIVAGNSVEEGVSSYASVSKGVLVAFLVGHFLLSLWYSGHYQHVHGSKHEHGRDNIITFPAHLLGIVLICACLFYSNFEDMNHEMIRVTHEAMTTLGSIGLALIGVKYLSHSMFWLINEQRDDGYKAWDIIKEALPFQIPSCTCKIDCYKRPDRAEDTGHQEHPARPSARSEPSNHEESPRAPSGQHHPDMPLSRERPRSSAARNMAHKHLSHRLPAQRSDV